MILWPSVVVRGIGRDGQRAGAPPTPTGTAVTVTDGAGVDRAAQVLNVLSTQITFVIPVDAGSQMYLSWVEEQTKAG